MPETCVNLSKCARCSASLVDDDTDRKIVVGKVEYATTMPTQRCEGCGERYTRLEDIGALEMQIAADLAQNGVLSAEAFRFMRKAIGVRAVDLAQLFDVTAETISRWEGGKLPIPQGEMALLGGIVEDTIAGLTTTRDRLTAMKRPEGKVVTRKLAVQVWRETGGMITVRPSAGRGRGVPRTHSSSSPVAALFAVAGTTGTVRA